MTTTAETVMKKSQGAKCCYIQSDEISILLTDCDSLTTEAWFDYNLQKMVSISAGIASATFSGMFYEFGWFDCRVFNVPVEEVCNYFIWRQKDWIRNSISMLARSHFSHSELMNKNTSDMHEMLYTKNVNWADLELQWKNGTLITKEGRFHPIFTEDRSIIENLLKVQE
jgi:tRNA(His) 5'-end guanylyltransferase